MWIKSKEGKLINLDRVDTIGVNPLNSIICKIGDRGICLGSYKSEEQAKVTFNYLQEVLKSNGKKEYGDQSFNEISDRIANL